MGKVFLFGLMLSDGAKSLVIEKLLLHDGNIVKQVEVQEQVYLLVIVFMLVIMDREAEKILFIHGVV